MVFAKVLKLKTKNYQRTNRIPKQFVVFLFRICPFQACQNAAASALPGSDPELPKKNIPFT